MPKAPVFVLFGVLLALSMGIKLVSVTGQITPDTPRLAGDIESTLRTAGYAVRPVTNRIEPYVLGQKGTCRVFVSPVSAIGYSQFRLAQLSVDTGVLEYRYAGSVSRDFPRTWPVVAHLLQRFGRQAGLDFTITPVLAVAKTATCPDTPPRLDALRLHARFTRS